MAELRKHERYEDFGRVECPQLCFVHGVLDNISKTGCKVHFDAPVSVSLEGDYELQVRLSRDSQELVTLVCRPRWIQDDNGTTSIGFEILRSPSTARLDAYIIQLAQDCAESDDDVLPAEEPCQFI